MKFTREAGEEHLPTWVARLIVGGVVKRAVYPPAWQGIRSTAVLQVWCGYEGERAWQTPFFQALVIHCM